MNKRGQVYILAALLLSFIIFSLVVRLNVARRTIVDSDFEGLTGNYDSESAKFINLLSEKTFRGELTIEDVNVLFLNFTQDFTRYSKTQNPDFGVIYFFDFVVKDPDTGVDVNRLLVGNYLDQPIVVWTNQATEVVQGCRTDVIAGTSFGDFNFNTGVSTLDFDCSAGIYRASGVADYEFRFIIGDIEYVSNIDAGEAEIGIVAQEFSNNERRVFINEFKQGAVVNYGNRCGNADVFESSFVCDCTKRTRETCDDVIGRCFYEAGSCSRLI